MADKPEQPWDASYHDGPIPALKKSVPLGDDSRLAVLTELAARQAAAYQSRIDNQRAIIDRLLRHLEMHCPAVDYNTCVFKGQWEDGK